MTSDSATLAQPASATYLEAIRAALFDELEGNPRVVVLGEDIGVLGGAFRVTQGMLERFGESRIIDTPIAETAIVGAAIGLSVRGWRPVVEMQFADFISCAYDQLVTEAAKLYFRYQIAVPIVVRCPSGGGLGAGPFHSQNPEGVFAHIPGLKIACPATVQDASDLLRASIRDPNPVLFFEHKALYRSASGPLRRDGPFASLGRAAVRHPGDAVTLVTYGGTLPAALAAAEAVAAGGRAVEVIDLRSLVPLDMDTVRASVAKTGRVVIAHEDTLSSGIGAEIAARLSTEAFFDLDAPIVRVTAPDTPPPLAEPLEVAYVPSATEIEEALWRTLRI